MEEKLLHMLGALEYSDLLKIQRDLSSGGLFVQNVVDRKLRELETTHRKLCATCGKEMHVETDDVYTLVFGERTIKKKASFCGIDCLENFTDVLKDHNLASLRTTNRRL
jgi:hypothetical protein